MEKISGQQSVPLWDRQQNERGHKTSVDKAVAAHRNRVEARRIRTEARLAAAREVNSKFFPKPQLSSASYPTTDIQYASYQSEYLNQPAQQIEQPFTDVQQAPLQVSDLYDQLSVEPVREYANEIIAKDQMEANMEVQSDEIPKGSYVDYNV